MFIFLKNANPWAKLFLLLAIGFFIASLAILTGNAFLQFWQSFVQESPIMSGIISSILFLISGLFLWTLIDAMLSSYNGINKINILIFLVFISLLGISGYTLYTLFYVYVII